MSNRRERTESCVSASDFSPLVEVLESVPAEEVVQTVPMDVHKNKEDSDKVSNEGSDEDWEEVFPEKTTKEKNKKKRERTEADKVSNEGSDEDLDEVTPVKKKAKKSPSKAPAKKLQGLSKTERLVGKST